MSYTTVAKLEKAYPKIKHLSVTQKINALKFFNTFIDENEEIDKDTAIEEAIIRAKKADLAEMINGTVFMLNTKQTSIIEILRIGTIHDRGLKITEEMLEDYVKNFNEGVYGTKVQVNLGHDRDGEAAGWISSLIKEGDRLLAEVDWTPLGQEKIKSKQYQFTSAELALTYPHFQTGDKVKNVLVGVALTNIPAVKGLAPVQLSEEVQVFINNQTPMSKEKEEKISEESTEKTDSVTKTVEPEPIKEELKDKEQYVTLAEYEKTQKANKELTEKVERMELTELTEKSLMLHDKKPIGFVPASKEDLIKFLLSLTPEQRIQFVALMEKVQTVDLSVHGSSSTSQKKEYSQEAVVELTEKKLAEAKANGKPISVREAQKLAEQELA